MTNFLILRFVVTENGPMYGNLKYKQLFFRATLWEESGVKWLLRNFLTTSSKTLEGNNFLLYVLVRLFISFHVQPVVPVILVKPVDTSPLAYVNIHFHIFKHLRGSENCRSLCFKILDSASTSFQLKIKEARYILWEQPSFKFPSETS